MTIRVRAGDDVSVTLDPGTNTGTWSAIMTDATGHQMQASASAVTGGVRVTVNSSEWHNGSPGLGRIELKRVEGTATTYPLAEQVRILPGTAAGRTAKDYG